MAEDFNRAVDLIHGCAGRVVVSGMGKSGIIARKIAATLSSTGTPSLFMHPVDALHGDLGMLVRGDVVLALSASGETEEILRLLATIKRLQLPLISMTGDSVSARSKDRSQSLHAGRSSRISHLDCSIAEEACSLGLAPTASTTTMLALGDALAVAVSDKRGFQEEDFANLHPGGKLGKHLARVESLMHRGEAVPCVSPTTRMPGVIYEMSRKKLGHDHGGGKRQACSGSSAMAICGACSSIAAKMRWISLRASACPATRKHHRCKRICRHCPRSDGREENHVPCGRRREGRLEASFTCTICGGPR